MNLIKLLGTVIVEYKHATHDLQKLPDNLCDRGFKFKGADTPQLDAKSPNPFSDRPSTARQNAQAKAALEAALDDLDKPSNMPDGLDPSVWHRMCNYRRAKIECENLVC